MEKKKDCTNCRYYLRHYVKSGAMYVAIFNGHCINSNMDYWQKRKAQANYSCEHWEPMEIQIEERKRSILSALNRIAAEVDEIKLILSDDIKERK